MLHPIDLEQQSPFAVVGGRALVDQLGLRNLVAATVPESPDAAQRNQFSQGLVSTKDIIAPSAIEVDFDWIRINNTYYRTLFIVNYPRFVTANWLSSLINFDHSLSVSMYLYPSEGKEILDDLRRKIAEMEAELSSDVFNGD